ncbi:Copper binding protein, plastocyanin/azurin family [Clostridiaceae bacterium JG1575]|nr:Copper binding protein, plastocyanin/azurin family [Clostridiaceae bacterium JG1575]
MRRVLSSLVAAILLLTTVPVQAAPTAGRPEPPKTSKAARMLDAKVQAAMQKNNDKIPVIVYFKDSLDTMSVAANAKEEGRDVYSTVVDALKSNATQSQQSLMNSLTAKTTQGEVSNLESFYITNAVAMKASAKVLKELESNPQIKSIVLDELIPAPEPIVVPSTKDPREKSPEVEWNVHRVGADLLWEEGYTGEGVTVGIIDTGVDAKHPALARKWKGAGQADASKYWLDAISKKPFPYDEPTVPHGTHCMGTILGSEEDGSNKIGVAPQAKWIAAKAFTAKGGYMSALLSSGQFMLDQKVDVVNNSWGQNPEKDDFFADVVKNWRAAGIVPVFAAGNAGPKNPQVPGSINCPANYLDVLAVAATNIKNELGSFSLLGPTPYDPKHIKPDISAPGVNIRSSVHGGQYQDGWNGTSMATPHIVGVVALMKQALAGKEVSYYEDILRQTAIQLTDDQFRVSPNMGYGYGLVDAYAAVHATQKGELGTVTGRVTTKTQKNSSPIIAHKQVIQKAFLSQDLTLKVRAKDEVSITGVQATLTYQGKAPKVVSMVSASGNEKDGEWKIDIPMEELVEGTLKYSFEAVNFHGKKSKTPDYNLELSFGLKPGEFKEDFEKEPYGWPYTGQWEWGKPEKGPMDGSSGDKVMATKLKGPYGNFSVYLMVSPPLDLRDTKSAYISFKHWMKTPTKQDHDTGSVRISKDGGKTWKHSGKEWSGDHSKWDEVGINLNEFCGSETPVYVSWDFVTDGADTGDGWFIDDVELKVGGTKVPQEVTGLKESAVTINQVDLTWDALTEPDLDCYEIQRTDGNDEDGWRKVGVSYKNSFSDYSIDTKATYRYRVFAVNFGGNKSPKASPITVKTLETDPFFENKFYSASSSFKTGGINKCWEYGEPDWDSENYYRPAKPQNADYVWGTNLNGDYTKSANTYIENTIPFDIPETGYSYLNFTHWFEIDDGNDHGHVQISVDEGKSWETISPEFKGIKRFWHVDELSLDKYRGKKGVRVRFTLVSDRIFQYPGWYISRIMGYTLENPHPKADKALTSMKENRRADKACVLPKPETIKRESLLVGVGTPAGKKSLQAPLNATLTMIETGRQVISSSYTGEYKMNHKVGKELTLRAESYGFEMQDKRFELTDKPMVVNFELTEKAKSSLKGHLVDATSKKPVSGATIRLREDARVDEVKSASDGSFTFPEVYVGNYTLVATHPNYKEATFEGHVVVGGDADYRIEMERFLGYNKLLSNDDGSAENAILLGRGTANVVVFKVDNFVKVKGARVYFWGPDWPVPGGDETTVAILRMDEKGNPLGYAHTPKVVQVVRGQWNDIDLSEYDFGASSYFGLCVIQNHENNDSPAVGIDTAGPKFKISGKSYTYSGLNLVPLTQMGVMGNFAIQANVGQTLGSLSINNLGTEYYARTRNIPVEGSVPADCDVNLYLNGRLVEKITTKDKIFKSTVTLTQDEGFLSAAAVKDGVESAPTKPIHLVLDQINPELTVAVPNKDITQTDRFLKTSGRVFDKNFSQLLIQGQQVEITDTGSFEKELILSEGLNEIHYVVMDKAGNKKEVVRKVWVGQPSSPGTLEIISPTKDVQIRQGEVLQITAKTSVPGTVSYQVNLSDKPSENGWKRMDKVEQEYRALYKAPGQFLGEFFVHMRLENNGQITTVTAPGKIHLINSLKVNRIEGKNRYETALQLARTFEKAPRVYLVNGEKLADSAVVGPLAQKYHAPILLAKNQGLVPETLETLKKLATKEVVIVGGIQSISAETQALLKSKGYSVRRIAGKNRYETSVLVAREMTGSSEVFLASGVNLTDAISAGSYGTPILLTQKQSLNPLVRAELKKAKRVFLLGGNQILDASLEQQIGGGIQKKRIAGEDRFATNLLLIKEFAPKTKQITIANGETIVDALTAAALDRPVLLTKVQSISKQAEQFLSVSDIDDVLILGGKLAVSTQLEERLRNLLDQ